MIYFLNASGGVAQCVPESVYQGSAEGNKLFLVSPHAESAEVGAAFRLPDGTVTPRFLLEHAGVLRGYSGENGKPVSGWSLALPASVTAQYGTVRVQFYFRSAGQGQEASASAQFTVERGVESQLPSAPAADAYADILSALSALRADLTNGYYPARASVAWNDGHVYGANELVYCSEAGTYGALVRSKSASNTQPPFAGGALNAQYWETVVNFDTIADDYFADVQAERAAAEAAKTAAEAAQDAAETAEANAKASETAAQGYAGAASESAEQAADSAEQAAGSATAAGQSAGAAAGSAAQAQESASAAAESAGEAAGSALAAQGYMEQAKEYAKKEYQVYDSFAELPISGDSAFIYLVPSSGAAEGDSYSEYLWIGEDNKYEYIGSVNDVDLSNYSQIIGTYPNMTVGKATNADNAANAAKADDASRFGAALLTSADDLNDLTGEAYWGKLFYCSGTNVAQHIPSGMIGGTILVLRSGGNATVQMFSSDVDSSSSERPTMFIRSISDPALSAWSAWEELATSDGAYPSLTAGKAQLSNNNLFYNGDFRLNTQGQSEYVDNGSTYLPCVDGWQFGYGDCTLEVLASGGVRITKEAGETNPTNFQTADVKDAIAHAGSYTVSFRVDALSSVQQGFAYYVPQGSAAVYLALTAKDDAASNTAIRTFTLTEEQVTAIRQSTQFVIGIQKKASAEAMTIYGAKLEEGEASTYPNGLANNATKALYAERAGEAEAAGKAETLAPPFTVGNASATAGVNYIKFASLTGVANWQQSGVRIDFVDDTNANYDTLPCGIYLYVKALSNTEPVAPYVYLLYGSKAFLDKVYISYNGTGAVSTQDTVELYYRSAGAYDTVAVKALYTCQSNPARQSWQMVTDNAFVSALPSGKTNTALSALSTFSYVVYAKYDADGNDIGATYAKKSDLSEGLQRLYPVGSIYLSAADTNPAALFGFGTWQAWGAGRVPVGVDASQAAFNAAEKTGGEAEHPLTVGEMPAHTHVLRYTASFNDSDTEYPQLSAGAVTDAAAMPVQDGSGELLGGITNVNAGGGQAHNNLQPYITCYMWKRTA